MSRRLTYPILFLFAFIFGSLLFLSRQFGSLSLSAILSTFSNLHTTIYDIPSVFIFTFIRYTIIGPFFIILMLALIHRLMQKFIPRIAPTCFAILYLFLASFLAIGSIVQYKKCFENDAHFAKLVDEQKHKYKNYDAFKELYIPPSKAIIPAVSKPTRNIIVLYVESLERTYSNRALFKKNLLAALDTPDIPYQDLPKLRQVNGTGWSIAGVVASQCGLPLIISLSGQQNRFGLMSSNFLPGATCLSDLFSNQGYKTVFLKNAGLAFAGFDVFLKTHQVPISLGFEHWSSIGYTKSPHSWGIDDDTLFLEAKKIVLSILKKRQKFYLFMLTANTHGTEGRLGRVLNLKSLIVQPWHNSISFCSLLSQSLISV